MCFSNIYYNINNNLQYQKELSGVFGCDKLFQPYYFLFFLL